MPKRIVNQTVVLSRKVEGKDKKQRIVPPIGDKNGFDFTADEIKEIDALSPGALSKITKEVADDEPPEGSDTGDTAKDGDTSGGSGNSAKRTSGKTSPAGKVDDEI